MLYFLFITYGIRILQQKYKLYLIQYVTEKFLTFSLCIGMHYIDVSVALSLSILQFISLFICKIFANPLAFNFVGCFLPKLETFLWNVLVLIF